VKAVQVKTDLDADCAVKLIMAADVFVGINTDKVDPTAAFMNGQVKIDGDNGAAGLTGKLFTKYEVAGADEKQGEELVSLKMRVFHFAEVPATPTLFRSQ
jgi:putative sterol carrier protein